MIIGFIGKKRSGKDTCADYVCENYSFSKYSFAYPLKEACKIIFGWTNDHVNGILKEIVDNRWGVSPRQALQTIGTELMQYEFGKYRPNFKDKIGRSIWVKKFEFYYKDYYKRNGKNLNVCIADVRFEHEIKAIKKLGGTLIKVVRPALSYKDIHESENIDHLKYDICINNAKDITNLYEILDKFMKYRKFKKI